MSRVQEERSGVDRTEERRGDPAHGGLWKAGGRADGSRVKQAVHLRTALRELLPAILQIAFEDTGRGEGNQEVSPARNTV